MADSYISFAPYYDILTSNIPYLKRGEYFNAILNKFGKTDGILLDLACGTGSLSEVMSVYGYEVIGVDASEEMLAEAINKRYVSGHDIMYLCQEMQNLDLFGTIDICICALDSINHVVDKATVQEVFNKVSLFMHPDGIFIFDVNTQYKHNEILANNVFLYDYDEVYCVWQNTLSEKNLVDIHLDLFCKTDDDLYEKCEEDFSERAYSHAEILEFLAKSKLSLVDFYGDDSFKRPNDETQRVIYVAKSMKAKV